MGNAMYSEEAEKASLGALLSDPLRLVPIARRMGLEPEAFYLPSSQEVCRAIYALSDMGSSVDVLLVEDLLRNENKLEAAGGTSSLHKLLDACPTESHGEYYFGIVHEKSLLRKLEASAHKVLESCYGGESAEKQVTEAADSIMGILPKCKADESNDERMSRTIARWEAAKRKEKKAIGLEAPWPRITELTAGLEIGVTILAGRPSQGKTTIEDQLACHLAGQGIPVARVTLDSTADELLARAMCRKAGVSMPKLKFGYAGESQLAAIREARDRLKEYPMFINDRDRDIKMIATWARWMKREKNIELLTIDFVQLVSASEMGRQNWDKVARVTYVSEKLKALALELRIPVLCLAQLNRSVEKEGREPMLSDLRDSGALEQDAHKVIFVYCDSKRVEELDEEKEGTTKKIRPMWLDVLKNKDGEIGRLPFWMRPPYFRFDEADNADFMVPGPASCGEEYEAEGEGEWVMLN